MRAYMNAECLDCGIHRRIETIEAALAHVCPTCLVKRALEDYVAWCGAMDDIPDPDSADEYLYVTSYGSHLPDWAQAKVREFAANEAARYGVGTKRLIG